jgi:hypothetical protein
VAPNGRSPLSYRLYDAGFVSGLRMNDGVGVADRLREVGIAASQQGQASVLEEFEVPSEIMPWRACSDARLSGREKHFLEKIIEGLL